MDISLHHREKGAGTPFILLHGNGEEGSYFESQIEYFSQKYRVIALDTRGHGNSPRGNAPFTIAQFAEDLNDFMAKLEIPKAIILGFSDGANIAMKFASKYPEKAEALILDGGNLDPRGVRPSVQIPIEIGYKFAKLFAEKSPKARQNAELLNLMVNDPNLTTRDLHKITAPTLVIAGTDDMIKKEHTEKIAENIKNSSLVFIKGDHFIANKRPAEFNSRVEKFLREIEK